jgi:hypothetical protein
MRSGRLRPHLVNLGGRRLERRSASIGGSPHQTSIAWRMIFFEKSEPCASRRKCDFDPRAAME